MFKDEFKARYTTIPFAIYKAFCNYEEKTVISHQHREIELIAMTEGAADFYIDSQCYRVEKGDVLIIPPYSIHRAKTASSSITSYDCICFDLKLLCDEELKGGLESGTLSTKHVVSRKLPYAEVLQRCIAIGCEACEGQHAGWELEAIGNMSVLFGKLKREGYFTTNLRDKTENTFAKRVLDYINESYSTLITSNAAASALYMNNSYFCRLFKKTFGCCFSDYVLAYRLEKAKVYLTNTNLSATEIAFRIGFNGCSYFGKTFKARFGLSPISYRKGRRKKNEAG